jgi:hypothetical protein
MARTKAVSGAGEGAAGRMAALRCEPDAGLDDAGLLVTVVAVVAVVPGSGRTPPTSAGSASPESVSARWIMPMALATPSGVSRPRCTSRSATCAVPARRPEPFQHVELAAHAAEAQQLGEPAQLVFLVHAARAQRALVQRREAQRVGRARGRRAGRRPPPCPGSM